MPPYTLLISHLLSVLIFFHIIISISIKEVRGTMNLAEFPTRKCETKAWRSLIMKQSDRAFVFQASINKRNASCAPLYASILYLKRRELHSKLMGIYCELSNLMHLLKYLIYINT